MEYTSERPPYLALVGILMLGFEALPCTCG